MQKEKFKVLMELRPCFEGFAGIPQETRLVFSLLNHLDEIEVTGLINHGSRHLKMRKPSTKEGLSDLYRILGISRVVLSTKSDPIETNWEKFLRLADKYTESHWVELQAMLGLSIKVRAFDGSDFGDFIWQTFFSKSLPASEFESSRLAHYATLRPPHDLLNRLASKPLKGMSMAPPKMDCRGYSAFISQTPWPSVLSRGTQLIVRYHDAIPVFLPHTIQSAAEHQFSHIANLRLNQKRGIFACTSHATRSNLLKVLPHVEKRAVVIPDVVSQEYFQESADAKYISSIIRNHVSVQTEPKFLTNREKERFYSTHLTSKPTRFLLMVSTLEPRKNHLKLISAWDYLVLHGATDLKLVIVGGLGWDHTAVMQAVVPHQEQGKIFHLSGVPSGQLRLLYKAADAVVCPSVEEGFDLTGIEAMLCGGAVVASDIPVHREIYGNACEFFNPYSMMAQAKAVDSVIAPERRARREELVEAGLKHAEQYRGENIKPIWANLFDRIIAGDFKNSKE
jgi:glycosyltransferase involved in cell wall biosynthesis